jgi:hypothetical protein
MKPNASHVPASGIRPLLSASALAVLAALCTTTPVHAATRYWGGGNVDIVANGDGHSDGVSGTWNTTQENWDQGSGPAHVAWVNGSNVANINGGSQTITLGANIILGGTTQKAGANGASINGGGVVSTLTLNNVLTGSGAGRFAALNLNGFNQQLALITAVGIAWPDTYLVPPTAVAHNPGLTVQKDIPANGFGSVTLTLPLNPGGKTFARLKVWVTP